jgi:PAS domain S-box-containing protein
MDKVLFVTENQHEIEALKNIFAEKNYQIQIDQAASLKTALDTLTFYKLFAIIAYKNISSEPSSDLLGEIQKRASGPPLLLITEGIKFSGLENLSSFNPDYVIPKTPDYLYQIANVLATGIKKSACESFQTQLDFQVIQNIDNPIIITDLKSLILFSNKSANSLFNLQQDNFSGKLLNEVLSFDLGPTYPAENISWIIQNLDEWNGEIFVTTQNNSKLFIELKLKQFWDGKSNKKISIGTYTDITEKKENEKRLHLLSDVVLNVKDGITITDLDNTIIFVNDSKAKMTGYSQDELIGKNISNLAGTDSGLAAIMKSVTEELLRNGSWSGELEEITKDGRRITLHLSNALLKSDDGKPYGIVGVSQDITSHKKLELQLQESEEWHRTLVENINGILIFLDKNGNIEYLNKPAENLLGYTISDIRNSNFLVVFIESANERQKIAEAFLRIFNGESLKGFNGTIKTRTQQIRQILYNISPLHKADGKISGIIVNGIDVTEIKMLERQIAETNTYLENIIENSADGIATFDLDAKVVTWNRACERIYGYSFGDVTGKKITMTVPEEYLAEWQTISDNVLLGKTYNNIEVERIKKDGSRVNLFITVSPIRDLAGHVIGISSFVKDVTEKKILEKQAYLSEIKYRQLFEESKDFVYESSTNGRFISINQAGVDMLGYTSKEEILELDIIKDVYVNPEERQRFKTEVAENGFVIDFELDMKKKTGELLTLIETATAVYNDDNNIIGYRGIGRDITEKKTHQERILSLLIASQALSRSTTEVEIFDTIAKAIRRLGHHTILMLREGSHLKIARTTFDADILKGAEKMYAFYLNKMLIPIKQSTNLQSVIEYKKTIFNESSIQTFIEFFPQHIPRDFIGSLFKEIGFKERSIYLPLIVFNEVIGLAIINSDEFTHEDIPVFNLYSAQLNAALENARLYSRLTKVNEDLKKAYEKLHESQNLLIHSEKLKAIGDLASGVAHDFNNLLGVIVGRTQLLQLRATEQKTKNDLDIILKAALDGAETVKRLQDFAKQKVEDNASAIDVNLIVEDTIQLTQTKWKDYAQQKGIKIKIVKQLDRLPVVLGSGAELREILTNLILNAVDAMPKGGTLTIKTVNRDRLFSIEIEDTGTGMDDETKSKIFDPFFSTKGDKGTGLGLAMVKTLVNKRQGDISVSSSTGIGTKFIITFPKVNIDNDIASLSEPMPVPAEPTTDSPRLTVLIIDDEEEIRILLAEILREADYDIILANDGKEGIEKFKSHKIDIVFTDLGMPELNGWQVAKTIKAMDQKVPIILISGWGRDLKDHDIKNTGVDFLASKPFHIDEIFQLLIQAKQRIQKQ